MKQMIVVLTLLVVALMGLFYVGGTVLVIGLSTITLTALIFLAFWLGARWAQLLITSGLEASARNAVASSQHEATKMKALVDLMREVMKTKHESLSPPNGEYPALPVFPSLSAGSDNFKITGLNVEEDGEQTSYQ
ncbi:MAG: hypothetical protein JXM69_15330 [Anaerolineae bacterium]|nr:hypothetical protein [Anaerolineae bacterium]